MNNSWTSPSPREKYWPDQGPVGGVGCVAPQGGELLHREIFGGEGVDEDTEDDNFSR